MRTVETPIEHRVNQKMHAAEVAARLLRKEAPPHRAPHTTLYYIELVVGWMLVAAALFIWLAVRAR